ncbi:hypothetical protein Glove_71g51 [Diversispora epigaea]|uniref:Uncharacterized protein n=1 Tax=Diversispora epigaea TaxID=1348612 RepID=A0A397J9T7_9GLOM|nr:hypothetical protein Glove_71g51 [Diversispora epigaea]
MHFWYKLKALVSSEYDKDTYSLGSKVTPMKFSYNNTLSLKSYFLQRESSSFLALTVEMMQDIASPNLRNNVILGSSNPKEAELFTISYLMAIHLRTMGENSSIRFYGIAKDPDTHDLTWDFKVIYELDIVHHYFRPGNILTNFREYSIYFRFRVCKLIEKMQKIPKREYFWSISKKNFILNHNRNLNSVIYTN